MGNRSIFELTCYSVVVIKLLVKQIVRVNTVHTSYLLATDIDKLLQCGRLTSHNNLENRQAFYNNLM